MFRKGVRGRGGGREENEREGERRRGRDIVILYKVCKRMNHVKVGDSP